MWFYTLISVVVVSLLSLIGALTLMLKEELLRKLLLFFVAFSIGALVGDTFIHLFPEIAEENGFSHTASLFVLIGLLFFFVLEKILRWRHCHEVDCIEHPKHLGSLNLIGDSFHNFIDGAIIGASYLVSPSLGVATTIAVVLHEIPHELGNFGVLLHSGFTAKKALLFNSLSGLTAIIGAILALIIGSRTGSFTTLAVPFTAGGFLYIALSDLIPELHKENEWKKSLIQLFFIVAGVSIMYLLVFFD